MKKFLFIFALVLSLVLAGTGSVAYAMDYPSAYPDLPDSEMEANILFVCNDKLYAFVFKGPALKTEQFGFYLDDDLSQQLRFNDCDELWYYKFYSWDFDNDNFYWTVDGSQVMVTGALDFALGVGSEITYSDIDIYNKDGALVFPLPPGPLGMPEGTLTQILTQENPLKEILTLLPMAIPCLVGFVALRKALRTLETILKTA